MASSRIFKVQKLMRGHLQYGGNIEQRVQRQGLGDVWSVQMADKGGG